VLMGAGIPREIPAVLDAYAEHRPARLRFDAEGDKSDTPEYLELDPAEHWSPSRPLARPKFLGVISAASLAATLARKATGVVDGFIVEGPTAGGHNAPPRGQTRVNEQGEPVYGERDVVDLSDMRAIGVPFWLAGGMGTPEGLAYALSQGAAGIQVGTLFAYADESGIAEPIKQDVLHAVRSGGVSVKTDPRASPTGFPFKVVSVSEVTGAPRQERTRNCDLGYLRVAARTPTGFVYRCAAEPVDAFVDKGGDPAQTVGRQCLCNGLTATIGLTAFMHMAVSLGLMPRFERNMFWDPRRRLGSFEEGSILYNTATPLVVPAPEGVYVFEARGLEQLRLFDHKGQYIRTVYPFPSDKLKAVKGLNWRTLPLDEQPVPSRLSASMNRSSRRASMRLIQSSS